jgi:hypothetical protein
MRIFIFIVGFVFAGCGTENYTESIIHPQDPSKCLSCDVDLPTLPPISDTADSVKIDPLELNFFCIAGSDCENIQFITVYNFTQETIWMYKPVIISVENDKLYGDASCFKLVKETKYPISLRSEEKIKVFVEFDWEKETRVGVLQITANNQITNVSLIGKLFVY